MRPDSASTRAEVAVDEALWWLHKNQNREAGYWNNPTDNRSDYRPAAAAGAVQALLTNGHRPEGDPTEDPYVETVNRGFDYLFSTLQTRAMTPQPYGNPDTNGNGLGLEVYANRGYQQGMIIDVISSTQHMLGMARTGIAGVKGAFYFDIVTDMVDALIFGQNDSTDRGGWRYDWNYGSSDNSISQWGAISLLAADNHFGIKTPAWVMEENKRWLAASFIDGYYCYRPAERYPWSDTVWHATQPSALIQMAVNNIYVTNAVWRTAEMTIADNWDSVYGDAANRNYYALYAVTKAMRLARPRPVTYLEKTFLDWYNDDARGVRQKLLSHQAADGSWAAWYSDRSLALNTDLSTAWAVMMLTPTLFSQAPVPVITAPPVWGYGAPLTASAQNSFHVDPSRRLVSYEWDFDGDGTYDYQTADPLDPAAQWTYPDPHPDVDGDPPTAFTIRLRVMDDSQPPQTAVSTFTLTVAELQYDADGDGIADAWERTYWGDLTTATAHSDFDGDGFSDLWEFLAGTDPTDATSLLIIENLVPFAVQGQGALITWRSVPNRFYRLDRSTNLLLEGGGFMPVTSGVPGRAGASTTTLTDPTPPPPPVFYRIHAEQ